MTTKVLIDSHNRRITYLRVSVTDRCDYRCVYCMGEDMQFLPRKQLLSLEETARLVHVFADLGINKVRLTGGEPLIRQNIDFLIREISRHPNIQQIALTTNASRLNKMAFTLKQAGIQRLNISLDTLDAQQFTSITRNGCLVDVLDGIDSAIGVGLNNIRLNAVVMRGKNDSQILPLVAYAIEKQVDLAFIEEMPLGAIAHNRSETFMSNEAIRTQIAEHYALVKITDKSGGPADYWQVLGERSIRIGFISPHSCNFCADCNRLRLTVEGQLILCLGQENSLDLRALLRGGADDPQIAESIQTALQYKPKSHDFLVQDQPILFRHMSHTGG